MFIQEELKMFSNHLTQGEEEIPKSNINLKGLNRTGWIFLALNLSAIPIECTKS